MPPAPLLARTKQTLGNALPQQLDDIIASYNSFAKTAPPEDAKGFAAHHSACKAALAHLDQLIKLAHWVEEDSSSQHPNQANEVERLIEKAKQAVSTIKDTD